MVLSITAPTYAWNPGDPTSMHFPQVTDVTGWSVATSYPVGLADDWESTRSENVLQIDLWGSWKGDVVGTINEVVIRIFDNDTSGAFAKPGNTIMTRSYTSEEISTQYSFDAVDQGYFLPVQGLYIGPYGDHSDIWQYTFGLNPGDFFQQEGSRYWLMVGMDYTGGSWGWSTSSDHYGGNAVYRDISDQWAELRDPSPDPDPEVVKSLNLDMAFVMSQGPPVATPEPATVILLGLGAMGLVRRRGK